MVTVRSVGCCTVINCCCWPLLVVDSATDTTSIELLVLCFGCITTDSTRGSVYVVS